MSTAREMLYSDVLALVKIPYGEKCQEQLALLLDGYRVQAKARNSANSIRSQQDSGSPSKTARELLANDLCALWQKQGSHVDLPQSILTVIDRYRMQRKNAVEAPLEKVRMQGSTEKKSIRAKSGSAKKDAKKTAASLSVRSKKSVVQEPLAGGPQKRSTHRGQCPKCHSMGVVLARSYANDEYLSCIYCGFQAFKASVDAELDLPLAAELLSRQFDEHDSEDPEAS